MKILFDQGTPVPLRKHLTNHAVMTAFECGWATLKNGALLEEAEASGFAVLVTTDQNPKYQQNLSHRTIAIVVILSTSWPRIQERLPIIQDAIDTLMPGEYREIPI
jgi:hypothetical protein